MEFPIVDLSQPSQPEPLPLTPEVIERYFSRGELFNDRGKWKYTVWLDYRGLNWDHADLWANAATAFNNATDRDLSGVVMHSVPDGWSLVILDPWGKNSHPIMLKG